MKRDQKKTKRERSHQSPPSSDSEYFREVTKVSHGRRPEWMGGESGVSGGGGGGGFMSAGGVARRLRHGDSLERKPSMTDRESDAEANISSGH